MVRKYWARSVWGVVGGQADVANVWEDVVVLFQDDGVWISCRRVECRNGGVEVDVGEVFVGVDSVGCVSCGAGERKHEVRDGNVQGSKIPRLPAFKLSCALRRA